MGLFGTRSPSTDARLAKVAACALAGLLALAPLAARADEAPVGEPVAEVAGEGTVESPDVPADADPESENPELENPEDDDPDVPSADVPSDEVGALAVEPLATGSDVVTLRLAEGTRDYGRAQSVVDAVNRLRTGGEARARELAVDGRLQRDAFQRAAETAVWQSATRPTGGQVANATELRFHGAGIEPAAVVEALAAAGDQLVQSNLRSIGVGCWEQGGERFYVVLLKTGAAQSGDLPASGAEPWAPEVQVDLSGRTSPVLRGRLQASGYRTNLAMVPGSTRAIRLLWVTAPESADADATDLTTVAVDPTCLTWATSDEAIASVSPTGVVTMHGTSILTPTASREAGADISATLEGTERALAFHVSAAVPVYRLYNPGNGAHLWTTDANEYRTLPQHGWTPERAVWQAVWSPAGEGELTGTPVYRLLNPTNGDHHYTVDANEYATLPRYGWRQEGVAYYSADGLDGQSVYRIFNGYQTANGGLGAHLWTTDAHEYATLGAGGWTQEGAGLYGVRP